MRRVILALCVLLAITAFSVFHAHTISRLDRDMSKIMGRIEEAYQNDDWQKVRKETEKLIERWNECEIWMSMTIKTTEIEDIDVSLEQSREYANIESKEGFIGEFSMFRKLVEHLPRQEGIDLRDLL